MPVHLPLLDLGSCPECGKSDGLRLCSRCGEVAYCSTECQKTHWKQHGKGCGKTDKINLSSFYPILACLAEFSHNEPELPPHPGLMREVLNDVNPGSRPCRLPGGQSANLLILGDIVPPEVHRDPNSLAWMPQAKTLKILSKMRRRILREGYALQIALALCIALTSSIYTTTSGDGPDRQRVRLHYGTAPIADFGVCAGSADVKNQDKLAYWLPDGDILLGQDPDEHYYIYLTTVRGELITIDFAMFTFNMCLVIVTDAYIPKDMAFMIPFAPVFFRDREIRKNSPNLYKERKRFSVLRDPAVQSVFSDPALFSADNAFTVAGLEKLVGVMETMAGRKSTEIEARLFKTLVNRHSKHLHGVVVNEQWKRYPEMPQMAIEQDPGECDDLEDRAADWYKEMKKWKRKHRKTKKSHEQ